MLNCGCELQLLEESLEKVIYNIKFVLLLGMSNVALNLKYVHISLAQQGGLNMFENVLFLLSTYYTNNCRPFIRRVTVVFLTIMIHRVTAKKTFSLSPFNKVRISPN